LTQLTPSSFVSLLLGFENSFHSGWIWCWIGTLTTLGMKPRFFISLFLC